MKYFYSFILLLTLIALKAQDNCASAFEITSYGTYTVNYVNGTAPASICTTGDNNQTAGEWYKFTPTADQDIYISTNLVQNGGRDTRLNVFTGSCNNLVCVGGNDDVGGTDFASYYAFNVTANTTYYIVFDNRWTSNGFDFEINELDSGASLFSSQSISLSNSSNKGVVDLNGDFLDDIPSISTSNIEIHYQNTDGSFTVQTHSTNGISTGPSWSLAAGDIDNNGYNDLLYGGGSNVSFLIANANGTAYTPLNFNNYVFSQRSNFVDINNDGHLDAFVCHDVEPNVYFLNDGNNNLVFGQGGLGDTTNGGNYGSIWVDYDNDGDSDLFIAKCRGGNTNASLDQMHRNNGDGTFTNVAATIGLEDPIQTWSSAWGDFDNDGDLDVLVGANSFSNGGHKLMKNVGGYFENVTAGSGFDQFNTGGREFETFDFDNDGYLDIYTNSQNGTILFNDGDMTFTPYSLGFSAGPVGDLNHDGFLDIVSDGVIHKFIPNDNHWLVLHTIGTQSNRNGIGARIELHGSFGTYIREVRSGEGFAFTNTLNTHFGLGENTSIDNITVKWPSGIVDVYVNPTVDSFITLTEGETLGVEDIDNVSNPVTIYPNPVKDLLSIKTDKAIKSSEIYSAEGKLLIQQGSTQNINVQTLQPGVYVLKIELEDSTIQQQKFIKK